MEEKKKKLEKSTLIIVVVIAIVLILSISIIYQYVSQPPENSDLIVEISWIDEADYSFNIHNLSIISRFIVCPKLT